MSVLTEIQYGISQCERGTVRARFLKCNTSVFKYLSNEYATFQQAARFIGINCGHKQIFGCCLVLSPTKQRTASIEVLGHDYKILGRIYLDGEWPS